MSSEKRTVTVIGTGKESIPPDLITVSMTVETVSKDYAETTVLQAEKVAEITAALSEAGFEKKELTTSAYNICTQYENYQDGGWKKRFVGYHCVQNMSLKFEQCSEKLKKVIEALSGCKSSVPQFDVSLTVRDRDRVSDELLSLAVKDAHRKAKVLAEAAGAELGEICRINYNPEEISIYSQTRMTASRTVFGEQVRGLADTEINPEEIEVSAQVEIVWEIR
ncbi:MAG: SIMPL domain-containing protein [Firmicutes bacterium]|nr:SIMPL domain-containing protein [[Eubacterium] siraeum]MCM1487733.1 SIMPL domain-containing protein [Bacillota bacterium]